MPHTQNTLLFQNMGELVRRLDYERKSKQNSLMRNGGWTQHINKEYSATVRAANDLEERKKDLFILSMEKHKKLFLNHLAYEKKTILNFKNDLDTKSKAFDEREFLELRKRVQSAKVRRQKANKHNSGNIGPVTEIVPRQYYRTESAKIHSVKFNCEETKTNGNYSDTESDPDSEEEDVKEEPLSNFRQVSGWTQMSRRPSSELMVSRRQSYAEFVQDTHIIPDTFHSSKNVRRQSAPPRVMSAYIPSDVSRISLRRSSKSYSSHGSSTSLSDVSSGSEEAENASRSFRLLRQTYKKKRKEQTNPREEILKLTKEDHFNKTKDLETRTKAQFEELLSDSFHQIVIPDNFFI